MNAKSRRHDATMPSRQDATLRELVTLIGAFVGALTGCSHSEPFTSGTYTPGQPYSPSAVSRLTFNPGTDRTPAWLPDGTGILYSLEREDRPDLDRCLGLLPPRGGTLRRVICNTAALADDSVDSFEWPAVAPDGRLAYVRAAASLQPFRSLAPDVEAIVLGTLDQPLAIREVQRIGYPAPTGRVHGAVSHLAWLNATTLVYLAEYLAYPEACPGCTTSDTLKWGIEIATLDLSGTTSLIAIVPGTAEASSVAVGATGDTIYYTKNGDSRVYRYAFSSGQTAIVHDFGAAGIARDVRVQRQRLVAVVGGDVGYFVDPVLGPVQIDAGGLLYLVDLVAGTDAAVADTSFRIRRPALAPDGRLVVVEAVTNGSSDLWLLELP